MLEVLQTSLRHNGPNKIVDKMVASEWASPFTSVNHRQGNFLHFLDCHWSGQQSCWEFKFVVEAAIALDIEFFPFFRHCLIIINNEIDTIFCPIFDPLFEQIQALGVEMDCKTKVRINSELIWLWGLYFVPPKYSLLFWPFLFYTKIAFYSQKLPIFLSRLNIPFLHWFLPPS
jgi:hypothetical protein